MSLNNQQLGPCHQPEWERLLESDSQCATVTIETTGKLFGLSRAAAYAAARAGEIPTIRFGRRLVVPKAALRKLLAVS
jgi:hypothetical protein